MKRLLLLAFTLLLASFAVRAQDKEPESLGLPGDNLNLYAVLKIFQESKTLEEFEKRLNDEEEKINNLDLDNDDKIDYITVTDNVKDDVHNIALEIFVNKDEKQSVAVFVVAREKNGGTTIQVVGDEDLYGKDYIIEPQYADEGGTPNPGYAGNQEVAAAAVPVQTETKAEVVRTTFVEVNSWPIVTYIYVPTYNPWVSPWYWGYYPGWWRPWRPHYWHWYYGYHFNLNFYYSSHYRRCHTYRHSGWHVSYYGPGGYRHRSPMYYNHYNQGIYRKTYAKPETRLEGAANYAKKYPTAPGLTRPVPEAKVPGFKPDLVKPVTRPSMPEKPAISKPMPSKPDLTRPTTRPMEDPTGDKIKPTQPIKPMPSRPTTRPVPSKPTTRPAPTRPSTRPSPTRPTTRPVTKPSTRPAIQQPATRPGARTMKP